jgi:hypothetical protein
MLIIGSEMNERTDKKRVLIFVVSYKAEKFIKPVLARIPENITGYLLA